MEKSKDKYENILDLDPEDMLISSEVERISLGRLYAEEQVENFILIQSNFEKNQARYNGELDLDGKY